MVLTFAPRRGLPKVCRSLQSLQLLQPLSTKAVDVCSRALTSQQTRAKLSPRQRRPPVERGSLIQHLIAEDHTNPNHVEFQRALAEADIQTVLRLYPPLVLQGAIRAHDGMEVMRVFQMQRRNKAHSIVKGTDKEVERFLRWYKQGRIPAHPRTSMLLLSFFKETMQFEAGLKFWSWLRRRPENSRYMDSATYGGAIELLADAGKDLNEIEDVYNEALSKSLGFSSYHLSPGAILQNRDQPSIIRNTSMTLLQGIIRARLINNDWLNAYLALDTAFRLHPTQLPTRFLTSILHWRPVPESFEVFCCICRAGSPVTPVDFTTLLNQLTAAQKHGSADEKDLQLCLAMISALHHMVGANQELTSIHLGIILKGMFRLFPIPDTPFSQLQCDQIEQLSIALFDNIFSVFSSLLVRPTTSTVNQLLVAAGDIKSPQLIEIALSCLRKFELTPNEVTFLSAIKAAGRVKLIKQVQRWWAEWSKHPEILKDSRAWEVLARAVLEAEQPEFFGEAIESQPLETQKTLNELLANETELKRQQVDNVHTGVLSMPHEEFTKCMTNASKASEALKSLHQLITNREVQDFQAHPPHQASIFPFHAMKQEAWQSALYEELTCDKSTIKESQRGVYIDFTTDKLPVNPDKVKTAPNHLSLTSTNLPLGTIRYQNFSSINTLLLSARRFEADEDRRELDANTARKNFRSNLSLKNFKGDRQQKSKILRNQLQKDQKLKHEIQQMDRDEWRNEVMALRARGKGSVSRLDDLGIKWVKTI